MSEWINDLSSWMWAKHSMRKFENGLLKYSMASASMGFQIQWLPILGKSKNSGRIPSRVHRGVRMGRRHQDWPIICCESGTQHIHQSLHSFSRWPQKQVLTAPVCKRGTKFFAGLLSLPESVSAAAGVAIITVANVYLLDFKALHTLSWNPLNKLVWIGF